MGWEGWFRIQGWVWEDDSEYKVRLGSRFGYKDGLGRMVQDTRMG